MLNLDLDGIETPTTSKSDHTEISFWGMELWTRRAVPPKLLWLFLLV